MNFRSEVNTIGPKNCIIGVDMGTTSVKTVAFSNHGQEIYSTSKHLKTVIEDSGVAEQDPDMVYEAVTQCLAETAAAAVALGFQVERIGLSSAMHSLLCVSEANLPLTPAMIWMDTRAQAEVAHFWETGQAASTYERTGTPIHPMAPLAKLMWLRNHDNAVFQQSAKFVSLKEWVWYKWFRVWQIDESMASATGLYNLQTRSWDHEVLHLLQLTPQRLSQLVSTTYLRQDVRDPWLLQHGISDRTTFNIGASDGVLANLASGVTDVRSMALTIGTSLAVRMGSGEIYTDRLTQPFCYVLDDERYVMGGPSNSGGIVLEWLAQNVLGPLAEGVTDQDRLGHAIEAASNVDVPDLFCLPYVAGERAPLWNAQASGVLVGLRLQHTAAHVMRSAIEGILLNAHWIAQPLIDNFGKPEQLVTSGRLMETAWVRQLTADVFGIPVQFHGTVDASVLGAVLLANQACVLFNPHEPEATWLDPAPSTELAISLPDSSRHAAYQLKYSQFRKLANAFTGPV